MKSTSVTAEITEILKCKKLFPLASIPAKIANYEKLGSTYKFTSKGYELLCYVSGMNNIIVASDVQKFRKLRQWVKQEAPRLIVNAEYLTLLQDMCDAIGEILVYRHACEFKSDPATELARILADAQRLVDIMIQKQLELELMK